MRVYTTNQLLHQTDRGGSCSLNREGTYECTCNAEQCWNENIRCLEAANCHLDCNGDYSCSNAQIIWPLASNNNTAQSTIKCNGIRACSEITFPQPSAYTKYEFDCNQIGECQGSVIKCPLFADCHIVCSEEFACYDTLIEWSPYFVQSTLSCTHSNGCNSATTRPPKVYQYSIDGSYSYSRHRLLSDGLHISNSFDLKFKLRMNEINNANYTILSLMDGENNLMTLSMNYQQNLIQIGYHNANDAYLVHGVLPNDALYHSFQLFINQNGRHVLKMDDTIYLNVIASTVYSPFSSLSTNNHTFSLFIGHPHQQSVTAKIKDIQIGIDLLNYFGQSGIYTDALFAYCSILLSLCRQCNLERFNLHHTIQ